jgi:hypothetical protein
MKTPDLCELPSPAYSSNRSTSVLHQLPSFTPFTPLNLVIAQLLQLIDGRPLSQTRAKHCSRLRRPCQSGVF